MVKEIENYITKRYDRWLDYSSYYCQINGLYDESVDLLNEVLLSLLCKDENKLIEMFQKKKGGYSELDFFILRMIKLNVNSSTSPYQHKYHHKEICIDRDVNWALLKIEDVTYDCEDKAEYILNRLYQVRDVFETLNLSYLEKSVFEFRFFQDGDFKHWTGPENTKKLYQIYNKVCLMISKNIALKSKIHIQLKEKKYLYVRKREKNNSKTRAVLL